MYSKTGDRGRGLMLRLGIMAAMAMVAVITLFGSGTQSALATSACTYSLSSSTYQGNEGTNIPITVNRTGTDCQVNNAILTFSPGSAHAGTNYSNPGPISLGFGQGNADSQPYNPGLPTIDDLVSGDKSLTVALTVQTSPDTVNGSASSATITISDIDGTTFTFAQNYVVSESIGSFIATVNRSGPTTSAASVQVQTLDGSAIAPGDYTAIPATTLNFAIGQASKLVTVYITNDSTVEGQESFSLVLSGQSTGTVGSNATVTINDDDSAGLITLTASAYSGYEGDGQVTLGLMRTGSTAASATVYCTTQPGTATAGTDYTGGSFLATFAIGASSASCAVPLTNDSISEPAGETFGVQLTGLSGAGSLGSPQFATVTIYDNSSGQGTVQFASSTYVGYEGSGAAVIGLTRTISAAGQVTVYCQTLTGGTAMAGVDYTAGSYPAVFANGASTATCSIPLTNDAVAESLGETVMLGLTDISAGATYGFQQLATLTILDGTGNGVTVTGIAPNYGPSAGGNLVVITGTNFGGATSVSFGGSAVGISANTGSQITVTAPAHVAGTVEVVVNNPPQGSNSTLGTANDYTYTDGPTITSISPNTGPASGVPTTFVTITGANFIVGGAGMTVSFGGTATTNFNVTDVNTIIVIAPAHTAGTFDIVVTTPGGSSPISVNDQFTYTGSSTPVVSSVSPNSGATGITVTIAGSGFTGVICPSGVTFGGVAAASCTVNSDTSITAVVPSTAPGGVSDVRVTNAIGTSANTVADNFNNTSTSGATITYNLVSGFNLIGWSGIDNISAAAALKGQENPDNPHTNNVYGNVTVIWRFDSASQSYKGFFPGSENVPGANDFTTLQKGVGYFVAINVSSLSWTVLEG